MPAFSYDKDSNLITPVFIPVRQVWIIFNNLSEGKTWDVASPVYPITREVAAFILAYPPYNRGA